MTAYALARTNVPTEQVNVNGSSVDYQWQPRENGKANESFYRQAKGFAGSGYGYYRGMQLPSKVLATAAETAKLAGNLELAHSLKSTGQVFGKVANAVVIPYWGFMTFEVNDQLEKVSKEGATGSNIVELARVCLDWTTAAFYSLSYFMPGVHVLPTIAGATDSCVDTIELGQAAAEWTKANNLQGQKDLSEAVQSDLAEEKKLQFIGGIKSAISVALHILGYLGAILGAAVVAPVVVLALGTVACALSIIKYFYKENMTSVPLSKWAFVNPHAV